MRILANPLRVGCLLAALLVYGCSSTVEERTLLPWVRMHTTYTKHLTLLDQSVPTKTAQYQAYTFGFWRTLDADALAVISADTVALRRPGGIFLLHNGDFFAREICNAPSMVGFPPNAPSVDCFTVTKPNKDAGTARGIDWKRVAENGAVSAHAPLIAEDEQRIILYYEFFYDEVALPAVPLFLTVRETTHASSARPPDCALLGWRETDATVIARLPDATTTSDCREAASWRAVLPTRLVRSDKVRGWVRP